MGLSKPGHVPNDHITAYTLNDTALICIKMLTHYRLKGACTNFVAFKAAYAPVVPMLQVLRSCGISLTACRHRRPWLWLCIESFVVHGNMEYLTHPSSHTVTLHQQLRVSVR